MTEQPNGLQTIADRHGVSLDAVRHLVRALEAGHGTMAQFDHPELGGFGQWSSGGMTMIGNMFDSDLKTRVADLCDALARALPPSGFAEVGSASSPWWPQNLGRPVTAGAQNGLRYAYFPDVQRLAIEADGRVALYETEGHRITGVSQHQGGTRNLRFSGPDGAIDLESLHRIEDSGAEPAAMPDPALQPEPARQPKPFTPEPLRRPESGPPRAPSPAEEVLTTLERLAELQRKGVLTDAEFAAKKAELLARL